MDNTVLFIPGPIRSHVIPTFSLAKILSSKFKISYIVYDEILSELVEEQCFTSHKVLPYRFGYGMEETYLRINNKKVNMFTIAYQYLTNKIFSIRKNSLYEVINKINPQIIIIDVFSSTDFLVLYSLINKIKIVFYNPMLSTYIIDGFPVVSQDSWEQKQNVIVKPQIIPKLKYRITSIIYKLIGYDSRIQVRRIIKKYGIDKNHKIVKDNLFFMGFENVPEMIIAPIELEFSDKNLKSYQYYLGLGINECRKDTELDTTFFNFFIDIKKLKEHKVMYCSFGTYYDGSDKYLFYFMVTLLEAIKKINKVQCICSVNQTIIDALKSHTEIPNNVHLFSRVPQLDVLSISDLFISHGGLGSIKESIFYSVPMLVYPLDLDFDQNGNAYKVEFHNIGMRGVWQNEDSESMSKKIQELLNNPVYKTNISKLNNNIKNKYTNEYLKQLLNKILEIDL